MPVYLHVFNLIIRKKAIIERYNGGLDQFKKDFPIDDSEINQEDDELISFGQVDYDGLDVDSVIIGGLDFDVEKQYSHDFTIVYRYGDDFWKVDWLADNRFYAWHVDAHPGLIRMAEQICLMTMDEIEILQEDGVNFFKAIKIPENNPKKQ